MRKRKSLRKKIQTGLQMNVLQIVETLYCKYWFHMIVDNYKGIIIFAYCVFPYWYAYCVCRILMLLCNYFCTLEIVAKFRF